MSFRFPFCTASARLVGVFFFALVCKASPAHAEDAPAGEIAYQQNCMACHLTDTLVVGPSLVSIAATYPEDKVNEFVAWAKNPGKKNPRLLQMPPMAHVPEETLIAIHNYILKTTEGKTESNSKPQFPGFKEPDRELPYVVRAFLPHTSPASVAIVLEDNISVCWDTESCRFRYAWSGSKTRLRQGHTVVKLEKEPFYREVSETLWISSEEKTPKFQGYKLRADGSPVLLYTIGSLKIHEHIANGAEENSFVRHFTVEGATDTLKLDLSQETEALVFADKGEQKDGILTLSREDATSFRITITRP